MHELSIAENLVSTVVAAVRANANTTESSALEVREVRVRLGRLAGVEKDSLLFCYDMVTADTSLAGSRLIIEDTAVVIFCARCQSEVELPGIQSFLCPRCGQPGSEIRQGRELELATIELAERSNPPAG
ncbi:MAG: hydrogenase maturation nickel metallochaperone HypA [Isosphaeraceae bacterium]